jgi:hypothetical protein
VIVIDASAGASAGREARMRVGARERRQVVDARAVAVVEHQIGGQRR